MGLQKHSLRKEQASPNEGCWFMEDTDVLKDTEAGEKELPLDWSSSVGCWKDGDQGEQQGQSGNLR